MFVFPLSLNGLTLEVCSLGAAITKFLVSSKLRRPTLFTQTANSNKIKNISVKLYWIADSKWLHATAYTPVDGTSIHTTSVSSVNGCRHELGSESALVEYAVRQLGKSKTEAISDTQQSRAVPDTTVAVGADGFAVPYWFDHNCILESGSRGQGMKTPVVSVVWVIEDE
jgi:hypothetical protein